MSLETVVAVLPHLPGADTTIGALRRARFHNGSISVLWTSRAPTAPGANHTLTSGTFTGSALRALRGAGTITVPGHAPLLCAGSILRALAEDPARTPSGGVAALLECIGVPAEQTPRFETALARGAFLIAVHCPCARRGEQAAALLAACSGESIIRSQGRPELLRAIA